MLDVTAELVNLLDLDVSKQRLDSTHIHSNMAKFGRIKLMATAIRRFRSQVLADEAALIACSAYVDLNPVRAGIADSPDKSEFTSVKERFDYDKKVAQAARIETRRRLKPKRADDWLTPVELDERKRIGACVNRTGAGASDKGFLPMSLRDYLQLVDCTGCQIRRGKLGRFPIELVLSWNVSVLTEKFGVTSYLILVGSSDVSQGERKRCRPKQRSDQPVGYRFQR